LDHRTGTKVAVKIANRVKDSGIVSHEYEVRAYDSLYRLDGIPKLYWAGQERDYYCMVIQLMGPSLQGLIYEVGGKFSLKTTLLLANQLLFRLEGFHKKGWLHRDIKPSNILIGVGKDAIRPYLADLGLAEKYRPPYAEERYKTLKLLGTELYASWNAHYNRRRSLSLSLSLVSLHPFLLFEC
jgi:serine/threonine protein kinase